MPPVGVEATSFVSDSLHSEMPLFFNVTVISKLLFLLSLSTVKMLSLLFRKKNTEGNMSAYF